MTAMLANVGVPMIFVQLPGMVCALVPIIVLEALLIRRWLPLSYGRTLKGVTAANIASTVVGVPLAWLAMLAVEFAVMIPVATAADHWNWNLESPVTSVLGFFLGIAWIGPVEQHPWMIPAASALLLIPSFIISVWIERRICLRLWSGVDPALVRRGVFNANVASYGLLFLIACVWLVTEYFG